MQYTDDWGMDKYNLFQSSKCPSWNTTNNIEVTL